MIPTSRQARDGREIAGLTQADLATAVASKPDRMTIQRALEAAGVIFIEENGEGPGVRMRETAP